MDADLPASALVLCRGCQKEKAPFLFTPAQLKRTNPRCRICCAKPRHPGGESSIEAPEE